MNRPSLNVQLTILLIFVGSILRPAHACGYVSITLQKRNNGNVNVILFLRLSRNLKNPVPSLKDVQATGLFMSDGLEESSFLQTPGMKNKFDTKKRTFKDTWTIRAPHGVVKVEFPIIRAFGSTRFCEGSILGHLNSSSELPHSHTFRGRLKRQVGDDVVFLLDTTGSMGPHLNSMALGVRRLLGSIFANSLSARVAVAWYNDPGVKVALPFSTSRSAVQASFYSIFAEGGGDYEEVVYAGVRMALNLEWRRAVRRTILIVGDGPPQDPERLTRLSEKATLRLANSLPRSLVNASDFPGTARIPFKGVTRIQVVAIGEIIETNMKLGKLATGTGGGLYVSRTGSNLMKKLTKAIEESVISKKVSKK